MNIFIHVITYISIYLAIGMILLTIYARHTTRKQCDMEHMFILVLWPVITTIVILGSLTKLAQKIAKWKS